MKKIGLPKGYSNAKDLQHRLLNDNPSQWEDSGKERALELFLSMSERVPAYKDFLENNGVNPDEINKFEDLANVPAVDKDNYLRKYTLKELSWDGAFGENSWVVSATTGSTGEPFYFPHQSLQDEQYTLTAEQYMLSNFDMDMHKTLYIVGFPMGAWLGGVFTYEAIARLGEKGYDISVITPGIRKIDIIKAIKRLGDSFTQIVIGIYAPFLRDVLEDGEKEGIDWKSLNVKFVFSAEAFPESFRDYVADKVGLENIYRDTLNHYGTVDLGTQAHETPLSIMIRRNLVEQDKLQILFPERYRQPTLCQYDPNLFYFEEKDQTLYCSAFSGLPLFRYDLKDYGGVVSYEDMIATLKKDGLDVDKQLTLGGVKASQWKLPFVYVYERNDFSVSFLSVVIYPDPIRKALQLEKYRGVLTGKFTMQTVYDSGVQSLEIITEAATKDIDEVQKRNAEIVEDIHDILMRESTEYPELFKVFGQQVKPVVIIKPYEDQEYFTPGTKQKWVVR